MPSPARVSLIVPHRNHAAFLGELLGGLAEQTRAPDEVIVVDDASDVDERIAAEATVAACPGARLVTSSTWGGPNHAINRGLEEATGDYVAITAADDWLAPNFFAHSAQMLDAHAAAPFVFSDPADFRVLPDDGARYRLYLSDEPACFDPDALARRLKRASFTFSTNTILWRWKSLAAAGGFDPALQWHADWRAAHALALTDGAAYLPENLTALRVRADSYSAKAMSRREGRTEVFLMVLEDLAETHPHATDRLIEAGVLPEYDLRYLPAMTRSRVGRRFLTARSISRTFRRQLWATVRDRVPHRLRLALRARAAGAG